VNMARRRDVGFRVVKELAKGARRERDTRGVSCRTGRFRYLWLYCTDEHIRLRGRFQGLFLATAYALADITWAATLSPPSHCESESHRS
jgi:hypothetical protein